MFEWPLPLQWIKANVSYLDLKKSATVFVHLFLFHQLKVKHKSVLAVKDVAEMERVNHYIDEMKKKAHKLQICA